MDQPEMFVRSVEAVSMQMHRERYGLWVISLNHRRSGLTWSQELLDRYGPVADDEALDVVSAALEALLGRSS